MNFYAAAALIASVFTISIGALVLWRATDREQGRLFWLMTCCIALWVIGCFGQSYGPISWAYSSDVLIYAGACLAPTIFLHFVLVFSGKLSQFRAVLIANYAISAFFLIVNVVPPLRAFLIAGIERKFAYRYIAVPGPLWYVLAVWYSAPVGLLMYVLYKGYRSSASAILRNKYLYFLLASGFLATGGTMYFGLVLSINMPMIDNFFTCGYGLLMSYAILNHRLIDLAVVIRRTLIYAVVMGALTVIYLGTISVFARISEGLTGYQTLFSSAIAAALITLGFQPLRKKVQTFVDRKFFRQYVDREEKLYELSRDVITHSSPEAMGAALQQVLSDTFHPKCGALFVRARDNSGFVAVSAWGGNPENLAEDNALVRYFAGHPQPFIQDLPTGSGASHDTRDVDHRRNVGHA